jgi:hypothetical protein
MSLLARTRSHGSVRPCTLRMLRTSQSARRRTSSRASSRQDCVVRAAEVIHRTEQDGTVHGRFVLTAEGAEAFLTALEPMARRTTTSAPPGSAAPMRSSNCVSRSCGTAPCLTPVGCGRSCPTSCPLTGQPPSTPKRLHRLWTPVRGPSNPDGRQHRQGGDRPAACPGAPAVRRPSASRASAHRRPKGPGPAPRSTAARRRAPDRPRAQRPCPEIWLRAGASMRPARPVPRRTGDEGRWRGRRRPPTTDRCGRGGGAAGHRSVSAGVRRPGRSASPGRP